MPSIILNMSRWTVKPMSSVKPFAAVYTWCVVLKALCRDMSQASRKESEMYRKHLISSQSRNKSQQQSYRLNEYREKWPTRKAWFRFIAQSYLSMLSKWGILVWHRLRFTKEVDYISLNSLLRSANIGFETSGSYSSQKSRDSWKQIWSVMIYVCDWLIFSWQENESLARPHVLLGWVGHLCEDSENQVLPW